MIIEFKGTFQGAKKLASAKVRLHNKLNEFVVGSGKQILPDEDLQNASQILKS